MAKLNEIKGIEAAHISQMEAAGVSTVEGLLEKGKTKDGRKELAKATSIDEKMILGWVNRADLTRIKGVSTQYSNLLEEAGVDTVLELSRRVPGNLHKKMMEANESAQLVKQLPTEAKVADWVEQAKSLGRMVEY